MPKLKPWHQPAPPQWLVKARERLDKNGRNEANGNKGIPTGSDLHLLEMACADYEKAEKALAFVANHLTMDEGDKEATEETFGLDSSEVVEMAHDDMINRARAALNVKDK